MQLSHTDPQGADGTPGRPLALAPVSSIPVGSGLRVRAGGRDIALFRVGETVHAMDDSCPHHGASLCSGRLQGAIVACPAHGLTFDVRTGCGTTQPPLQNVSYRVQIVDGVVVLDLPAA